MTRIKDFRFFKAISPLSRPIADSTHQIDQIGVDPLISQAIRVEDGYAYPNDGPGWGFRFEDKYLAELP